MTIAPVAPAAGADGALIPPPASAPTPPQAAGAVTLKDGTQLDGGVVKVMRAIRQVESNGDFNAMGDGASSAGAYQWNNLINGKHVALAKGEIPANFKSQATQFGLDPNDFSPANQNKVAYAQIASYKERGLTPNSIDALWNGAKPDPNNPGQFVHNASDRLAKFQSALSGQPIPTTPAPEAAKNPFVMFPAGQNDSILESGLKAAGNTIPSAIGFAKGTVDTILHPIQTIKSVAADPYQALVPEAARDLIKGDVAGAAKKVEEDPFGSVAPFVFGARGLAGATDAATGALSKARMAEYVKNIGENTEKGLPIPSGGTNLGGAIDAGIEKVGAAVTKPFGYAFGRGADIVEGAAKYGVAKATGLAPETISQITENPDAFTPEQIGSASRASLGSEIETKLGERIDAKAETGSEYKPIRDSGTTIQVDPLFLKDAIREATGLELKKGKWTAGKSSTVDSPTDVGKVQRLYDTWQSSFTNKSLTADEFLTLRGKLAKLANYEGIGKSSELESATSRIRGKLNTEYRDQIKGLSELDAENTTQSSELAILRKGLIDKEGNLTDAAVNRIANAAGKGKDQFLGRLEEISPGIGLKIRQLKAMEDIQNIHKVGTYTKSLAEGGGIAGLGAGLATLNVPLIVGSIATLMLTQPEVAVRMIRGYGKYAAPIATKVLSALKKGAGTVNNLPSKPTAQVVGAFAPRQLAPSSQ